VLRKNSLFVNIDKWIFCVDSVVFLGFIVNKNGVHVDGYPIGKDFINEGRGFSPTHLKFFLLVFSQIKRSQREDQA